MKAEQVLVSRLHLRAARQVPDLRGSSVIDLADAGVEAPNAAESGGESNLVHRQSGLIDQLLGKMKAARQSDGNGSRAQMPQKQAPKVACADSQPLGQDLDSTVLQAAFTDQTQSS